MDSFLEHINQYNRNGLIERKPGQIDGNAFLYTGHAVLMAKKLGVSPHIDGTQWLEIFNSHWSDESGLRRGGKDEPASFDDYLGSCTISHILGVKRPVEAICHMGWRHGWFYSGKDHSRFPGVIEHYLVTVVDKLSWRAQFLWSVGIIGKALFSKGTSGTLLGWQMVSVMEGQPYLLPKIASFVWKLRVKSKWGDIGAVFAVYFEPEHPLAIYGKGII